MTQTGTLTMSEGDSRLDGTLLARKGASDPLGAATNFLSNLGLQNGRITVTGDNGKLESASVIFITNATRADELVALAAAIETTAAATAAPRRSSPAKTKATIAQTKSTNTVIVKAGIKRKKATATARRPKVKNQKRKRRQK